MPSAAGSILTLSGGPATNRKNSTSAAVIAHNRPIAMRKPLRRRVGTTLGRASIVCHVVLVSLMAILPQLLAAPDRSIRRKKQRPRPPFIASAASCSLSTCALIEIIPDRRKQPWAMTGLGVGMRWGVLGWRLGDDAGDLVGLGVGG